MIDDDDDWDDNWDSYAPGNYIDDQRRREDTRLFSEVKTLLTRMQRELALTPTFSREINALLNKLRDR